MSNLHHRSGLHVPDVTRFTLSFPSFLWLHFPSFLFSSSPLPSFYFCGQQAFNLLSVESAERSHFQTADRLELADTVELLPRKRDIKDEERGRETPK